MNWTFPLLWITARQAHCNNIPADSPEAYYRRNLMIPFLDHIITELTKRFGPIQQTKVNLIPSVAATYPPASVTEVGELYKADLPSPHLLSTKFRRWKTKFFSAPRRSTRSTGKFATMTVSHSRPIRPGLVWILITYRCQRSVSNVANGVNRVHGKAGNWKLKRTRKYKYPSNYHVVQWCV